MLGHESPSSSRDGHNKKRNLNNMFGHEGPSSQDVHNFFDDPFQKDVVITLDDDNNNNNNNIHDGHQNISDDHLHNVTDSLLDDVFPNGIMDNFNEDFACNIDDFITDCSEINANSVDRYFPTDDVQTEYLDGMDEKPDFSKVKNEKVIHKKKKAASSAATKPPKREIEEIKNGFFKPCFPYSCLISLALKNSSDGQLSVSDIYSFVCDNFPFFEYANPGWKNSIRHNLSLNKCFLKIEQINSGSRKSCLWQFNPERIEKVEQELLKYDVNEVKKALRNSEDYLSIIKGEKGMPQIIRRAKTPDFGTENIDNPPKIMKQVVEYFSDASANQRSKQTVRQVAEQALNKLLMVKSDAPHPRVLKPITTAKRKVLAPKTQNLVNSSFESPQSSSSESNSSIKKEYIFYSSEEAEIPEPQYVEIELQSDEPFDDLFEYVAYEQPTPSTSRATTIKSETPDENDSPQQPSTSSGFSNFSLNGNPFRSCRFDHRNTNSVRPLKRSANPNLQKIGQIKDGQFISATTTTSFIYPPKILKTESNDYDNILLESKENYLP